MVAFQGRKPIAARLCLEPVAAQGHYSEGRGKGTPWERVA